MNLSDARIAVVAPSGVYNVEQFEGGLSIIAQMA